MTLRKSSNIRVSLIFPYHVQEAEQRRISEKNQRSPARKSQMHVTGTSVPYATTPARTDSKPLPDSIIQTLTQRVQNRAQEKPLPPRRRWIFQIISPVNLLSISIDLRGTSVSFTFLFFRLEHSTSQEHLSALQHQPQQHVMQPQKPQQPPPINQENQEKMLSVSGKKKCSHCGDELGMGYQRGRKIIFWKNFNKFYLTLIKLFAWILGKSLIYERRVWVFDKSCRYLCTVFRDDLCLSIRVNSEANFESSGRGAAMIIESLRLFYHMECFKCCVCHVRLGDGLMGTDVRVRNQKLHCHNCYSSDDGIRI